MYFGFFFFFSLLLSRFSLDFDPQSLTDRERESRDLHNPLPKRNPAGIFFLTVKNSVAIALFSVFLLFFFFLFLLFFLFPFLPFLSTPKRKEGDTHFGNFILFLFFFFPFRLFIQWNLVSLFWWKNRSRNVRVFPRCWHQSAQPNYS